ncbi:MAG: hypothetical protein ACLQJ0_07690 [Steroidobacteraceae bacterium]
MLAERGVTILISNSSNLHLRSGKRRRCRSTCSPSVQAIATEVADYSKKSFEESAKAFEQLLGAK